MSKTGKKYGTEYETVHKVGNIKFVTQNGSGGQVAPMETMTKGRIYSKMKQKQYIYGIIYLWHIH
ncbi:TPA: hypothetical protein U1U91_000702 [Streptococcus suis]|nr:hypothetical protein [Streptococcus suis]